MKLSSGEIKERNVMYVVPDGTPLPREVRATLTHYTGKRVRNQTTGQWGTRYSIPAYLAREWLERFA